MSNTSINRSEASVRSELHLWQNDLDEHVEQCELCDEENEDFCPLGRRLADLVIRTTLELVVVGTPRLAAEMDESLPRRAARKKSKQEAKSASQNVGS